LLPGVVKGVRRLQAAGLRVVVISNQSGVGRGLITRAQAEKVNQRFVSMFHRRGVRLDGFFWCPHAPARKCACRKPRPKLLKEAAQKLGVSWRRAISVGDRPSDIQLAQRAGGKGVLVLTGYGREWARQWPGRAPDFKAANFEKAVAWILREIKRGAK